MIAYTISLSNHRVAKGKGIPLLDITVKSGIKEFAPDWDFLMDYKKSDMGPEAEAAYTEKYYAKLNRVWREKPELFLNLFNEYEEVAFACYCGKPPKFCHRHLFVNGLGKMATKLDLPFKLGGELTK